MAIYLISSTSFNQTHEQIVKILGSAPYETLSNDTNIQDLLAELSYSSLFANSKNILIKDADFFGTGKSDKNTLNALESYMDRDDNQNTLIFTTKDKVDERKKIIKQLKSQNHLIICPTYNSKQLCDIIQAKLKKDGYQIDEECLYYIVNACSKDYDLIVSEIKKIPLYYLKPCQVSIKDLKEIITSPLENNNFKLIDAIISHDIQNSFKIYNDLMLQKVEPFIIINLLAREYRLLYLISLMRAKNLQSFEISKKLCLQSWQVDKYWQNSYNYTKEELINKLKDLASLDYQVKSGQLNKYLALEEFILHNA